MDPTTHGPLALYTQPAAMTAAGQYAPLLESLPGDIPGLAAAAHGLLIHEHMAHGYGVTLYRSGTADPAMFGLTMTHEAGDWWIAANLMRDAAALRNIELLPWDRPQPRRTSLPGSAG
jgi:hypothetical protein